VEAHYIFHPSTIWVRPLITELGPKKPPQKADFAMKQTNICRLSGDIKSEKIYIRKENKYECTMDAEESAHICNFVHTVPIYYNCCAYLCSTSRCMLILICNRQMAPLLVHKLII